MAARSFSLMPMLMAGAPADLLFAMVLLLVQARSKRSRFITLAQAATKSLTNFSFASALA